MARALGMIERFRSSDNRVKIATLSGVSVLMTVIALLVGVLPVFADHGTSEVTPVEVSYGGGSGACSATIEGRLPSAAGNELHINNPTPGKNQQFVGPDGTTFTIDVSDTAQGRVFDFTVNTAGIVVYDVIVNGGPRNNHYDYDDGPGTVTSDVDLHAPRKNARSLHNLSHVNICYDVPGLTLIACDEPDPEPLTSEGLFTVAKATIFANSVHPDCVDKRASFFIDNDAEPPTVTLAFQGDGTAIAAGRLDVTKDFTQDSTPSEPTDFENLEYDGPGDFVELQWCDVRDKVAGDGDQFNDVLKTTEYPSLDGVKDGASDATACKVSEEENAAGIQHTVVYFEFEDPNFR